MAEEVTDKAEVRQSSSSLLSAAASFRRPALTVMVLGAVIVVLARHTLAKSLLGGWVAFIALAHPLRRRLSRGSPGR